jgi:hypothetical protein
MRKTLIQLGLDGGEREKKKRKEFTTFSSVI